MTARVLPCRCTKCYKRHTLRADFKDLEFNEAGPKCECGNRKFFVDKWMQRRGTEQRCDCSGYHFPHRKNSRHCEINPLAPYYLARDRYGVTGDDLEEIFLECTWESEGGRQQTDEVPF